MPNNANQKLRLLYLIKILINCTDQQVGLTTNQILDKLEYEGISTERKSIYRDFKALRSFGLEVAQTSSHEWYLVNRPFDSEELTMLIDAIQSASFLTSKIAEELIGKLKSFVSEQTEPILNRQIRISKYVKMQNKKVFQNMKAIQKAIREKRKLAFKYFKYNEYKEKVIQKDGQYYITNPLELVYAEDVYYLLTYNESHEALTPYRIDRMTDARVTEAPITKDRKIATWSIEDDIILSFGIFDAEVIPITLEIDNGWITPLIDKFGFEFDIQPCREGWSKAFVRAPLSPQFYGWLFQLGSHVRIASPRRALDEFMKYLLDISNQYE